MLNGFQISKTFISAKVVAKLASDSMLTWDWFQMQATLNWMASAGTEVNIALYLVDRLFEI